MVGSYANVGNQVAIDKVNDDILKKFPDSQEAERDATECVFLIAGQRLVTGGGILAGLVTAPHPETPA